jgi:hypothetical protein
LLFKIPLFCFSFFSQYPAFKRSQNIGNEMQAVHTHTPAKFKYAIFKTGEKERMHELLHKHGGGG